MKFFGLITIATTVAASPAAMSVKTSSADLGKRAIDRVDCDLDWRTAFAADAAIAVRKLETMDKACGAPAGGCERMTCGGATAATWICGGAEPIEINCRELAPYGYAVINNCDDGTLESTVVGETFDTAGWSVRVASDDGCA